MRSRRGIYLGVSKHHSATVHLVLNPATGDVSPQYHVLFDDHFSTVFSNNNFDPTVWESLVISNKELETTFIQATDGTIIEPPDHQGFDATPTESNQAIPQERDIPTSISEGAAIPLKPELSSTIEDESIPQIPSPWEAVRPTPIPLPAPITTPPMASPSPEPRRSSQRNRGQHSKRLIESSNVASYLSAFNIKIPIVSLYGSSQTTYTNDNNTN
jgi:hypothetical protein